MKAWTIIGWTYDAACYCPECAGERFGESELMQTRYDVLDREGNRVHPIFAIDEGAECGDYCEECGAEINPPWPDYNSEA